MWALQSAWGCCSHSFTTHELPGVGEGFSSLQLMRKAGGVSGMQTTHKFPRSWEGDYLVNPSSSSSVSWVNVFEQNYSDGLEVTLGWKIYSNVSHKLCIFHFDVTLVTSSTNTFSLLFQVMLNFDLWNKGKRKTSVHSNQFLLFPHLNYSPKSEKQDGNISLRLWTANYLTHHNYIWLCPKQCNQGESPQSWGRVSTDLLRHTMTAIQMLRFVFITGEAIDIKLNRKLLQENCRNVLTH